MINNNCVLRFALFYVFVSRRIYIHIHINLATRVHGAKNRKRRKIIMAIFKSIALDRITLDRIKCVVVILEKNILSKVTFGYFVKTIISNAYYIFHCSIGWINMNT